MIGEAVTIWKKPMDGDPVKGFLNIELGTWGAKSSAVALAVHTDDYVGRDLRARGVTIVPKLTLDEIVDRYAACLGKAHALVADYKESLGVELPPEAVTSVAATLFIESRKAGV